MKKIRKGDFRQALERAPLPYVLDSMTKNPEEWHIKYFEWWHEYKQRALGQFPHNVNKKLKREG